jgi:hypothetical protein
MVATTWPWRTVSPSVARSWPICPATCGLTMTSFVVTMPVRMSVAGRWFAQA